MANKVNQEKLRAVVISGEGVVRDYEVDLADIVMTDKIKEQVLNFASMLRSLTRSKDNLNRCNEMIGLLEQHVHKNKSSMRETDFHNALYAHAVVTYGACFVRGGSSRQFPLESLDLDLGESPLHINIMTTRHKLFSHLDDDHDLRTDKIKWILRPVKNILAPSGPRFNSNRVLLQMGASNLDWMDHNKGIIKKIEEKAAEVAEIINKLVGNVEFENV